MSNSTSLTAALLIGLGVVVTGCAGDPPPPAAHAPKASLAATSLARPFVGTWRVVQPDVQSAEINVAIEQVVGKMNGLVRGFARDKLIEANAVPQTVEVKAGSDLVAIAIDGNLSSAPADGTPVKQTVSTGETMDVAMKVGAQIESSFRGEDRGRVNTYELRGDKMLMHVRVYADQLPEDLQYTLELERVSST